MLKEATAKFEHIATGYPEYVPINAKEFQLMTVHFPAKAIVECFELAIESIVSRGALDQDWGDQFFFEGTYLGKDLVI